MGISTILQCFIADEEMFEGAERYADGSLAKTVDKAAVEANSKKVSTNKRDFNLTSFNIIDFS